MTDYHIELELKTINNQTPHPNARAGMPRLVQLPRKTFFQKAHEDLTKCEKELREGYRLCKQSRRDMVKLLRDAITVAQEKNHDDELYVTYCNISVLIKEWYCESVFKNIINTTLLEAQAGLLERQHADCDRFIAENRRVKRAFDALDEAHRILEKTVEEKSSLIIILRADLDKTQKEKKELQEELSTEKAKNAELRKELEQKKASSATPQSTDASDLKMGLDKT